MSLLFQPLRLRDPHRPLRAAAVLGAEVSWPAQYDRARTWPVAGA